MDWTHAFLASLRKSGNVSQAARSVGVGRRTVYDRRENDPDFKAAWDDVLAEAMDGLEAEALKRAKKGSDTLLIFLLKSNRPEKYKDQSKLEVSGKISLTWGKLLTEDSDDADDAFA